MNKKWSKNSGVDYFELEMKHNYYDNILKKLKETTGLADIE